jgi:hypothetical protein
MLQKVLLFSCFCIILSSCINNSNGGTVISKIKIHNFGHYKFVNVVEHNCNNGGNPKKLGILIQDTMKYTISESIYFPGRLYCDIKMNIQWEGRLFPILLEIQRTKGAIPMIDEQKSYEITHHINLNVLNPSSLRDNRVYGDTSFYSVIKEIQ